MSIKARILLMIISSAACLSASAQSSLLGDDFDQDQALSGDQVAAFYRGMGSTFSSDGWNPCMDAASVYINTYEVYKDKRPDPFFYEELGKCNDREQKGKNPEYAADMALEVIRRYETEGKKEEADFAKAVFYLVAGVRSGVEGLLRPNTQYDIRRAVGKF